MKEIEKINYIISKITTYHSEHLLWETKVGVDNKNMDLYYSCWGKSLEISRGRAENLIEILREIL